MILESQGIYDVTIQHIGGDLTDNYNPSNKVLSLSDATYNQTNVAAIGVAAHECGHAMQHAKGYAPISVRNALVPFANWGSRLSWILIIVGILFYGNGTGQTLLDLGIIAFSLAVLFQLVKSFGSSSFNLCCSSSFIDFTVIKIGNSFWRKK